MTCELAYCEIYNPIYHGTLDPDRYDTDYIYTSLLYLNKVSYSEFLDYTADFTEYNEPRTNTSGNPFVRNTLAICPNSIHIVERIQYEDYTLCIIKTHCLKIIQRIWKRRYGDLLAKRKNVRNIMNRAVFGKWQY